LCYYKVNELNSNLVFYNEKKNPNPLARLMYPKVPNKEISRVSIQNGSIIAFDDMFHQLEIIKKNNKSSRALLAIFVTKDE
jgi:hypothetical protein